MKDKLSKEEYAQKMNSQRQQLYDLANEQLTIIISDPRKWINFLSLMARINYAVNNSLLVYAQKPNAKELKTLEKWNELNIDIQKDEKGIQIFEPAGEFKKRDGSTGVNYSIKYVFDTSQTNDQKSKHINYDMDVIRTSLLDNSCAIVASTDSSQLSPVVYDEVNNQMNILDHISYEDELNGLFKGYAYKEGLKIADKNKLDFISSCVGYMLSVRFHIENYNTYSFTGIMDNYFKNMDQKQIKNELNTIYRIYKPLKDRINYGIYLSRRS